jgi:diketogulonate reductase-like aldo/keto reductase
MTNRPQQPDTRGTNPTMATATTPILTLNTGVHMPALGLGVFQSPPAETVTAVETALGEGYRLIDTAAAYGNEREVGEAIRGSGVDRGEVFITTKLWISDYGYDAALRGFDASLRRLGVDYVDLYLLHQPVPTDFEPTIDTYKAAEKMLSDGRARAIGVSNFSPQHLRQLIDRTDVVPAVNQVELHPYFTQPALRDVHAELGIATQAWSPIGGVLVYVPGRDEARGPLTDPVVTDLAAKYGKTPAQVVLRWHFEHGFCAIPKSVKPHRIAQNFDVFDFSLTAEEVAAIDALDKGVRGGPDPELLNRETHPFVVDNS